MTSFSSIFRIGNPMALGYRNCRSNTIQINLSASYALSAEERLGIKKPKKPQTAFLKFANQVRPNLLAKNPGVGAVGIAKLASKHWEQLAEDAKNKMHKEYEKEFAEYKKEKELYTKSLTEEQKQDIKKLKEQLVEAKEKRKMKAEIKELGRPKKPMSSYLLFAQTQKDLVKGKGLHEYQTFITEKWRNISAQEKSVWDKKAHELLEAYKKELDQWEQKMVRMGNIDYVRNKALIPEKKKTTKPVSQ